MPRTDKASPLSKKHCPPCSGEVPPLTSFELKSLFVELRGWEIHADKRLLKSYRFKDFKQAMDLANKIADLAEEENHHPDLLVRWGELRIELWTHAVDALTESDFILAAKIDVLQN